MRSNLQANFLHTNLSFWTLISNWNADVKQEDDEEEEKEVL